MICIHRRDHGLKVGAVAKKGSQLRRIHSAFDLPRERFGHFELNDQKEGERLDRIPVVRGEIRLGDRAYLQPDRMAAVLDAGADVLIRAGWKSACWLDAKGHPLDLIAELRKAAARGLIDRPIWIKRKHGPCLGLRLVAIKKPPEAAAAARRKARRTRSGKARNSQQALSSAMALAFKRPESLIGLRGPPGTEQDFCPKPARHGPAPGVYCNNSSRRWTILAPMRVRGDERGTAGVRHMIASADTMPVVGRLASRDTLPPDHPTIPPPRFERNTVDAAAPKPSTVSCIGADMSVTGRVECAGQVRVLGRIVGPLRAAGVLIGDGGAVEGDVVAQEVTSRGRITGTVQAARVRLQGHAVVAGDIIHQSLAIEEFALFEGASRLLCAG